MVCGVRWFSVGGSLELSGEGGFGYAFSAGFASGDLACPACAGGVKRPGHEIQALQRCGFLREVPARSDGPCGSGRSSAPVGLVVQITRRITGIVVQERHDTAPKSCATAARSPDTARPARSVANSSNRFLGCVLGPGGVGPGAAISRSRLGAGLAAYRKLLPMRWTMHCCTTGYSQVVSGRLRQPPLSPSQTPMNTSSTPRLSRPGEHLPARTSPPLRAVTDPGCPGCRVPLFVVTPMTTQIRGVADLPVPEY